MPAAAPHKRALLISSPRNGLRATGPSLARMRDFLGRWGFVRADMQCIDGERATRAAIVAGFAALIEATGPADTVVVYYAGHGRCSRTRSAVRRALIRCSSRWTSPTRTRGASTGCSAASCAC